MRFAVGLPNVGVFGDASALVELAGLAEEAGWDAVFVWDHLLYRDPDWPVADPLVVASAIAATTSRMRLGVLMMALPRRRPELVAKQIATLDHLSGGRVVFGAGLGSLEAEYTAFGEDADPRVRADRLDEALALVARAWAGEPVGAGDVRLLPTPVQQPRPPVWVAGCWPARRPFRRAARWDGVMPTHDGFGGGTTMPPGALREIVAYVAAHRDGDTPFDVAIEGATTVGDAGRVGSRVRDYAGAGATWWVEAMGWWRGDLHAARRRILDGPPAS